MRGLLACLVVFIVAARQGADEQVETTYVPMWEVYGSSPRVDKSKAKSRTSQLSTTSASECTFPFEILFLQDASGSFTTEYWEQMAAALPELVNFLIEDHPGSTFSLLSYSDKPIESLGETNDYCWNTEVAGTTELDSITNAYKNIIGGGGYDWPENQFGALLAAIKSPETIPWRKDPNAIRVIVQITDAGPHYHQDSAHAGYTDLSDCPETYDENLAEDFCLKHYYPDPVWMAERVLEEGVYVTTMVVRYHEHLELAYRSWLWFNGLLNQSDAFVRGVEEDPATWLTDIVDLFADVRNEACGLSTTSVAPTTAEAASTTAEAASPSPTPVTPPVATAVTSTAAAQSQSTSAVKGTTAVSGSELTSIRASVSTAQGLTSADQSVAFTSTSSSTTSPGECVCVPSNITGGCCQPEVLIQLRRRPKEFDLHLVN